MSQLSLVTVALPCYNRAASLPLALASLVAQHYTEWECVLVDDGSTDDPAAVVDALGDARVRAVRLPRRMGRGVARQAALDAGRGDLFCKLDSDDWLYPDKLARQVELLAHLPEVGAVGSAIAVVDDRQDLIGVRGRGDPGADADLLPPVLPPARGTMPPPLARVPLMMRMSLARQCRYDPRLQRAEDTDFVLQLLAHTAYCVLPSPTYVYRQERAGALGDNLSGYLYHMRVIWKHRGRGYSDALRRLAVTGVKASVYGVGTLAGAGGWLIRRRSQPATAAEAAAFAQARAVVMAEAARLFGDLAHVPGCHEPAAQRGKRKQVCSNV